MQALEFKSDFKTLPIDSIHEDAEFRFADGWRYVQILAVNLDDGVDLVYSYMKDGMLENLQIKDVSYGTHLPSITDIFLEAFVCENEIHDLFNISFDGLAIDFLGNFYRVSTEYPMTIISPEKLAEREKQRKIEAAKAAKAAKAARDAKESTDGAGKANQKDDTKDAELEEKLSKMDPEKAAKVRAAMEAKKKKTAKATNENQGDTSSASKGGE